MNELQNKDKQKYNTPDIILKIYLNFHLNPPMV